MLRDLYDDPREWPRGTALGGWPTWRERLADPREAVSVGRDAPAPRRPRGEPSVRGRRIPVRDATEASAAPHPTQAPLDEPPPATSDVAAPPPTEDATAPGASFAEGPAGANEAASRGERKEDPPAAASERTAQGFDAERARLRQALHELEQAQRRVERDAERAREQARAEVVERLLPVMDNLDLSIQAAERSADDAVNAGLRLVREQFESVLRGLGLERFDAEGAAFDPAEHEAVSTVEVDDPDQDGRVTSQWQAGYRFGDRILRAAKVQVGKLRSS